MTRITPNRQTDDVMTRPKPTCTVGEAVAADEVVPDDTEQSSLHPLQPVLRVVGEDQVRLQTVPPVCPGEVEEGGGGARQVR